jgi:hypothetical protein
MQASLFQQGYLTLGHAVHLSVLGPPAPLTKKGLLTIDVNSIARLAGAIGPLELLQTQPMIQQHSKSIWKTCNISYNPVAEQRQNAVNGRVVRIWLQLGRLHSLL